MLNSENASNLSLDNILLRIGFGKFHYRILTVLGFLQFFDAVEMVMLSFFGPILKCFWKISVLESSLIPISVFIGMTIGSALFGKLIDMFGRKRILTLCACGSLYFSLLCAVSPTIQLFILSRTMIGAFIGGITSTICTFTSEITPVIHRGRALMFIQIFWPLGSLYLSILTVFLVPSLGWRLWLVFSILPMVFIIPFILWLPESPRYFLLVNRKPDAIRVVNKIANMNNSELISNIKQVEYKKTSLLKLFHPNYAVTTVITAFTWFVTGSTYYFLVLSSPIINEVPHKCLQNLYKELDPFLFTNSSIDNSCCFDNSWASMQTVFISISGEFVSYLIALFIIKFAKRKPYILFLLMSNSVTLFLTNLCISPTNMGILMLFGRGTSATLYGLNFLYASEVFPTEIRGFAIGIGNGFSRLGSIVSSIVVIIIMPVVPYLYITLFYSLINVVAFICIFILPYETKDSELLQTVDYGPKELRK